MITFTIFLFQMNMINYKGILIFVLAYSLLFLCAELLHYKLGVSKEYSRKFSHVGGGIIALFLPHFFDSHWYVLALGIGFFLVLYGSKKWGYLQSIHGVERKSVGSTIYPIAIYFCFVLASIYSQWEIFYIAVSIMVFADTSAYIAGTQLGWGPYKVGSGNKTIAGSIAFFVVCLIVFFAYNWYGNTDYKLISIVLISAGCTLLEAFSSNGWDNVSVPVLLGACLYLFF